MVMASMLTDKVLEGTQLNVRRPELYLNRDSIIDGTIEFGPENCVFFPVSMTPK